MEAALCGLKRKAEVFKVHGTIKRETSLAILIDLSPKHHPSMVEDTPSMWFPLSQVDSIHHTASVVNDTVDSIVVSRWIAKQKGLI